MMNARISHLHSAMGAQKFGEFGDVFGTLKWHYSFDSWTYRPKARADHLNGDTGIGICVGSSGNHEFEESHGETHETAWNSGEH